MVLSFRPEKSHRLENRDLSLSIEIDGINYIDPLRFEWDVLCCFVIL